MSISDRDNEAPLNRDQALRDDRTDRDARLTLSEEELAVGKRRMEAGEVDVEKRVETRHVTEQVPLSHDEVTIERRPIEPGMQAAGRIGEEDIRIPLSEEQAVVEKRVVPKEELVVSKRMVEETETVEADLRRERVDVDTQGDVRERDRN